MNFRNPEFPLPSNRVGSLLFLTWRFGDRSFSMRPSRVLSIRRLHFYREVNDFLVVAKTETARFVLYLASSGSLPGPQANLLQRGVHKSKHRINFLKSSVNVQSSKLKVDTTHTCSPSYPISDRPARPKNVWKTSAQSPGLKSGTT